MAPSTLCFWYAAIATQSIAAYRLWSTGLVRRYWVLSSWMMFSAVSLAALSVIPWRSPQYRAAYSVTCLFLIFLESAAIIELFLQLSDRFRNFQLAGAVLLGFLGIIAVASAAAVHLAWIPADWRAVWQVILLLGRNCDVAMAIVLLGSVALLRWPGVPIRPSATRASLIFAGHMISGWVVSTITIAKGNRWYYWQVTLPLVGACLTALLIATLLTRESEVCEERPYPNPEELRAARRIQEDALSALRECARGFRISLK